MTLRPQSDPRRLVRAAALPSIIVVGTLLVGFDLGRLSLWYDEVVTMRLARAESPAALLRLLGQIDATRAPLHPLLLQRWLQVFGTSELAGRSFSAICGVATLLLIDRIGRDTFGRSTALWASWLAALSPLLIYYGREARMYAWLVLVTCACWAILMRRAACARGKEGQSLGSSLGYIACLVALAYSHPLGLIMIVTLALASGVFAKTFFGSRTCWLAVHGITGLLVLPWLGHYLDHPPEHLSGRLPIKFLLGTPIGFIGGNFVTLAGFLVLAGYGLTQTIREARNRGERSDNETIKPSVRSSTLYEAPVCLLIWLTLPPLTLFLYSWFAHPIFGPARYTVFVAPAYLILVAAGLSRVPAVIRYPLALGMAWLSFASIVPMVFDPEIKGDWRAFAGLVERERGSATDLSPTVIVMSADPNHNVEVETARYYLPADCGIIGSEAAETEPIPGSGAVYLTVGAKRGTPVRPVPERLGPYRFVADRSFPGLSVYRGLRGP